MTTIVVFKSFNYKVSTSSYPSLIVHYKGEIFTKCTHWANIKDDYSLKDTYN